MGNYTTGIFIFLSPVLIESIQKLKCGPGCVQYNGFIKYPSVPALMV